MSTKAIVVNCSAPYYNLGAHKLTDWLRGKGHTVEYHDGDPGLLAGDPGLVCLSIIFSWDAPLAREIAWRMKDRAEIWCGGPGMFALKSWWKKETGLSCHRGVDPRFEYWRGSYRHVFASRGCPVDCSFCIVPKMEGVTFTLDWDFVPAPILCDNNLSGLPVEFQEHVIRRYQETGTRLVDANSGFEPRTFDEDTFERWKPLLHVRGPWRFAFDTTSEEEYVERMMKILRPLTPSSKRVYVLIGNEPIEACVRRIYKVIEWGGHPYVQRLMPLNALTRTPKVAYDWDLTLLADCARWANGWVWTQVPLHEYVPRKDTLPFGFLAPSFVATSNS